MSAEAAPLTAARRRKTRWTVAGVVALLVIVAVVAGMTLFKPSSSASSGVSTAAVSRRTLKILVSGTGSTVVADSVTVNPAISGTVERLDVSLGATVSAGDTLYTISSTDVQTQLLKAKASLLQSKQSKTQALGGVEQAENQLYSAKTQRIQADQSLDALESQSATSPGRADRIVLAERQVVSAKEGVDAAQTSLSAANLGVQVASANLKSSQQSYDDAVTSTRQTTVVSPIDGVVTALPVSVGSAVNAGTSSSSSSTGASSGSGGPSAAGSSSSSSSGSSGSLTISDLSNLKVQVVVSEVDVPSLKLGQKAVVTFDALPGKEFAGTVSAIAPNGTSTSGVVSYTVDIKLAVFDSRLRPDMTATADIQTKVASNVLVVPSAAVKTSGTGTYVEMMAADGTISQQKVVVGVTDDIYTEIKSGVAIGATVVTGSSTASTSSSSGTTRRAGGFLGGGPGGPGGN